MAKRISMNIENSLNKNQLEFEKNLSDANVSKRFKTIDIDRSSNKHNTATKEELKTYYAKIVKRANDRLRKLEEVDLARSSNAYNWLERRVYDSKNKKKFTKDKKGRIKFGTNTSKMSYQEIKSAVSDVEKFLEAKTSTPNGINEMYRKQYETFRDKYWDKSNIISFEDYSEFWKSGLIQNYKSLYGSGETVKLSAAMETEGLSAEEIENILRQGGFSENTQENEIPLSDLKDMFFLGDDFDFDNL